ncbi:MAG: citrate lyase subunit alpha, partial [Bacteroidetes bacterium]|nr:citrate lyase subunit alpha [Bacteroidota bacterium]
VTTLCGPGELIDVIVTERGIAINPLRTDLLEKLEGSDLPVKTITELKDEAEKICGKPEKARFDDQIIAVVKWVDGTVLDIVRRVKE